MPRVEESELLRWRALPVNKLLLQVVTFAKRDGTVEPINNKCTERWFANVQGREYELVTEGPKFYDTRTEHGGGGAVDFVLYLHHLDFKGATAFLRRLGV